MNIRRSSFTLYETLIALVLIAVIVPTALAALRVSANLESHAQRKLEAYRVGSNYLNELIVTGDWATADENGDFGDDYSGLSWSLERSEWENVADTVLILKMTVFYTDKGEKYSVVINAPVQSESSTGTTEESE